MNPVLPTLPDDIDALKAALLTERAARLEFEARAAGAEAMVAHLKLLIAKMKRDRFDASAERSRKLLDQLEMELEDLETAAAEDEAKHARADKINVRPFTRAKPVRAPLPAHLPRERVVLPAPTSCPCCGGKLVKLGEAVTETLESIPRRYKVIQTVREKFSAARVRRLPNRRRPSIRSPVAVRVRTCWRRLCMPNLVSISRSTAKVSGLPVKASISACLRWRIGWAPVALRCRHW